MARAPAARTDEPATCDPTVLMAESIAANYESASARAVGASHAVAFAFARHALSSLLQCCGLERGDEVALSPLTCKVVPLALIWAGLRPVYVDISPATLNIDPEKLTHRLGSKTRAVMFQHTYGSDAGVADIARVARDHRLLLVEDCAQCLPVQDGRYAPGRTGLGAVFSNNLLKPLPAASGGLVTTDDGDLAKKVRHARDLLPVRNWSATAMLRAQVWLSRGLVRPSSYWPILDLYKRVSPSYRPRPIADEIADEVAGLAFRPSAFQAREGERWLARLPAIAAHRRACCHDYGERLSRAAGRIELPPVGEGQPLFYFPVLTDRKAATLQAARARRLPIIPWPGATVIYPVERMEALPAYGYEPGSCPVAESVASRLIGLPTDPDITAGHRERIAGIVTEVAAT
jgi:perosamine synthetase